MLFEFEIAALVDRDEAEQIEKWKTENGKGFFGKGLGKNCQDLNIIRSAGKPFILVVLRIKEKRHDETNRVSTDKANSVLRRKYYKEIINEIIEGIEPLKDISLRGGLDWKVYQLRYKLGLAAPEEYYELFRKGSHLAKENMEYSEAPDHLEYRNDSTILRLYRNPNKKIRTHNDVKLYYDTDHLNFYTSEHTFQGELILKRDRIQWLIGKLGFPGRSPFALLKVHYIKAIELYMFYTYLQRIIGTGMFMKQELALTAITESSFSATKKQVLQEVIREVEHFGGTEAFLQAVDKRISHISNKRNTAQKYLNQLNDININPITCQGSETIENIVPLLPITINVNLNSFIKDTSSEK